MNANIGIALYQLHSIAGVCNFLESPQIHTVRNSYPVTVPPDLGSGGFETGLWLGLGMVGIWAAMDAHAERAQLPKSRCQRCQRECGVSPFTTAATLPQNLEVAMYELEDVRNLYAHNFAGRADAQYFGPKRSRHVITANVPATLSSGALFDGTTLTLGIPHLRFYAARATDVLQNYFR